MNVSRETFPKLLQLEELIQKWSRSINLVSKASLDDLWSRHIVDSAQIYALAPGFQKWCDLGSGGGFPSLVIAVLAYYERSPGTVFMIESDQRKAEFLRHASRELSLRTEVICGRIEEVPPISADVLSARALASLDKLLDFTDRHLAVGGKALFPKGRSFANEISEASIRWTIDYCAHQSVTDEESVILEVKDISRV